MKTELHIGMRLGETLRALRGVDVLPISRLRIGSPCKFIRKLDLLVHIVIPVLIESILPGVARYLRKSSPRWGRSWRNWE